MRLSVVCRRGREKGMVVGVRFCVDWIVCTYMGGAGGMCVSKNSVQGCDRVSGRVGQRVRLTIGFAFSSSVIKFSLHAFYLFL